MRVELSQRDGQGREDEYFFAEQKRRLVKNSEEYYRSMFRGRNRVHGTCATSTWWKHWILSIRHLERGGQPAKVIVWAHNSHLGDARATEMGDQGEWNVGQLVREKWSRDAFLIGFTTYSGSVMAAANWDEPGQGEDRSPGLPGSYEALFHLIGVPQFFLPFTTSERLRAEMSERRLERAIGVIYRPESERTSHYFNALLPQQFDAVIHFDRTSALTPLAHLKEHEKATPETFPVNV